MSFSSGFAAGSQVGGNILAAMRLKSEEALGKRRLALGEREAATAEGNLELARKRNAAEYGAGGFKDRALNVQERQVAVAENTPEARAQKRLGEKPVQAVALFTTMVKDVPELGPALNPLLESLDKQEIATRGDLRGVLFQMNASGAFAESRVKIREKASKLRKQGKYGEEEKLMQLYHALGPKKFENTVDDIMQVPYSMRRSAAEKGDNIKPGKKYSKPVWDPKTQGYVYYDMDTGEPKGDLSGPTSRRIKIGPNGEVLMEEGAGLTNKTQSGLEQGVVDTADELVRLDNMVKGLDTKFLTVGGKATASLLNIKEKLSGKGSLDTSEKQYLTDYSTFAQDSVENINLYIKRITGAQMSEKEAARLRLAQPDMGDNWFAGDGPTKFQAKLQNSVDKVKAANSRYLYYLQKGLTPEQVTGMVNEGTVAPLSQFEPASPDKIDARGDEIAAQLKKEGVPESEIESRVVRQLQKEFGGM